MLMFVAQQLIYSQISFRNSGTIYQGYSPVFQVGGSSPKLKGNLWKWDGIFTINKWYIRGKMHLYDKWGMLLLTLDFHFLHI